MNRWDFDIERFCHQVEAFHGHVAPGVVVGGFMVNLARSYIPEDRLFDAISETASCLPDAIQLLTPCTIGNGWLKVLDFGRYAVTLYDKKNGHGFRVFLVPERIHEQSEIGAWFFKLKPKNEQNTELLMAQIKSAGETLCAVQTVQVKREFLEKRSKGKIVVCPVCQEAYPVKDGWVCKACQGGSPYDVSIYSGQEMSVLESGKSRYI
ncbi:MAG: FmdE, Molybdenum formylmethanofuran dehydrogenase operon [Syntrophorhabdus sp. PtaU1.Bin058]|nr:MAG: FmdE, Molybdenum formylmethanofuran dehydrogenase operon [Syntrophorhabdus sp. PtaU1.Bin058]